MYIANIHHNVHHNVHCDVHFVMNCASLTETLPLAFVKAKFRFWISPNLRSKLFSAAAQPSCRLVSDQCLGQWNLIELHSDFVDGWHMATKALSKPLIVSW